MPNYNLIRYQSVTEMVSADGDFKPKKIQRAVQTHVYNKSYAICLGQKKKLETMKWPEGTYFIPEEVEDPTKRVLKKNI